MACLHPKAFKPMYDAMSAQHCVLLNLSQRDSFGASVEGRAVEILDFLLSIIDSCKYNFDLQIENRESRIVVLIVVFERGRIS